MSTRQPTVIADAYMIVRRGDEIAMLLRSGTGYKDNEWGPPSGKIEPGESYLDAAVRELAEECGLEVSRSDLRFMHVVERLEEGPSWLGIFFESTPSSPLTNREPHKHAALEWFRTDALPENTIGFIRHVLEAVDRGEHFSEWTE